MECQSNPESRDLFSLKKNLTWPPALAGVLAQLLQRYRVVGERGGHARLRARIQEGPLPVYRLKQEAHTLSTSSFSQVILALDEETAHFPSQSSVPRHKEAIFFVRFKKFWRRRGRGVSCVVKREQLVSTVKTQRLTDMTFVVCLLINLL